MARRRMVLDEDREFEKFLVPQRRIVELATAWRS
jgi:hypothetical protein